MTARHRRSPIEQARDILVKLRRQQAAKVAEDEARLNASRQELAKTDKTLETLGMEMLPEMEVASSAGSGPDPDTQDWQARMHSMGGSEADSVPPPAVTGIMAPSTLFKPHEPKVSPCPHARTHMVGGVSRCTLCHERVIRTGE